MARNRSARLMFLVVPVTLHGMEQRTKAQVAEVVQRRMDELRIAPPRLVELTGVDKNTVRDFLAGKRRLQATTQLRFDDALRWEPGSLRRMYRGGKPAPAAVEPVAVDPLEGLTNDELLAEIRRRMEGARRGVEGEAQSPTSSEAIEEQKTSDGVEPWKKFGTGGPRADPGAGSEVPPP